MNKKLISILTVLILFISISIAWSFTNVIVVDRTPFKYKKMTITTDAVSSLNATFANNSGAVFLTIETNSIRYKIEGGDPTSTDGHLISSAISQNLWLHDRHAIRNLKMIAIDGNSTVHVTYYRTNR